MAFWKRRRRPVRKNDAEGPTVEERLAQVEQRLGELEPLAQELDRITIEWEDWFSKFSALYARLNKRVEREAKKAAEQEPQPAPVNPAALRLLGVANHGGA